MAATTVQKGKVVNVSDDRTYEVLVESTTTSKYHVVTDDPARIETMIDSGESEWISDVDVFNTQIVSAMEVKV